MHIAMSSALALMLWQEFKFLHGDFSDGSSIWLLIGFLMAILVISAVAAEAALILRTPNWLHSRADWPADDSESTSTMSQMHENLDGSDTPS